MTARAAAALAAFVLTACHAPTPLAHDGEWRVLFDGATLASFAATQFGGEGAVTIVDGAIELEFGNPLTGVTWTGAPPRVPYELRATAARLAGNDFFCGLTFPAGADHLTLVLGGWGGSLCGLSCLDGDDAAHNPTRSLHHFAAGEDHVVVVRVTDTAVEVTLDGGPLCAADLTRQRPSLRSEVLLSKPLGVAAFATRARVRDLRWRPLRGSLRRDARSGAHDATTPGLRAPGRAG